MATLGEVVAQNTEVLKGVKAILAKAEDPATETPKDTKEENEENKEGETEEKKDVTREEYDALLNRVAELEKKVEEKDEETASLKTALEASTETLKKVNAFFGNPTNKAMLAEGADRKAKVEAVDPATTTKTVAEKWLAMPHGKEAEAYFKAHEAEIIKCL